MKPDGFIFVAYIMNEYSVITYAFKEKHIKEDYQVILQKIIILYIEIQE